LSVISEPIKVSVKRRKEQAQDIFSVELEAVSGTLPPVDPGAHVDVEVESGCIRQYSLCQTMPDVGVYRLGILRDPNSRGGSAAAFEKLREGAEITIGAPRNNFALREVAGVTYLFAGGIGITPLLAMAGALQAAGRPFELHYTTRSRAHAAFLDELGRPGLADRVRLYHDDAVGAARFDLAAIPAHGAGGALYVCGPAGYIDAVCAQAKAKGWPDDAVHVERFQNEADRTGGAFTVVAALSGVMVEVGEGESIAEKLLEAGVDVPLSCEEGMCGACLTPVLEGQPDHRDVFQTEAEKRQSTHMTVCCSRALSAKLVLDI